MLESRFADFFGYDLSRLQLANLDFSDSICWQTNFSSSRSQRTFFKGAFLSRADFSEANLEGAVMTEADLTNAIFVNANLCGVDFSGAIQTLTDPIPDKPDMWERKRLLETRLQYVMANISGATFKGVKYDENINWGSISPLPDGLIKID
jgi:uncharacterized protein YjbI with pentapeptide repeats